MTLSENESLGLKSVSESLKNDKEMENKDSSSGLDEGKGEKKRFVIVLKKMGSLSKGSPTSNKYMVQVKDKTSDISNSADQSNKDSSNKVNSKPLLTQALEKTPTITSKVNFSPLLTQALEKSPSINSRVKGPLSPKFVGPLSPPISLFYPSVILDDKPQFPTKIGQTSTTEGTQTSAVDEATSPKSPATQTEESSLPSSANLFLYEENELTSAACNLTDVQTQHLKDHGVPETPVILMKPMTTLLNFTLDFDHFPSSPSMIKLARIMKMPWSQVKEWFSFKRKEKRKNGFHLHNKLLKYCPYCQNQLPFTNKDLGQQHLYEEDHINQLLQIEHQNSENVSGKNITSTTLDNVIIKALGFNSVGGQPSIPPQNVGSSGSLNDNRVNNNIPQKVARDRVVPVKKRSAGVRKEMPSPEEYALLIKPLQQGFSREVVYRATVDENHSKKFDVYYKPPVGKKLRSRPNVEKYLEEKGINDITWDNFDFGYCALGENVENEEIRYATASQRPPTFRNQQYQEEQGHLISTPTKTPSKSPSKSKKIKNPAKYDTQGTPTPSIKPIKKSTNVMKIVDQAIVARILAEANSSKIIEAYKNNYVIAKNLETTPIHNTGNNGIENKTGNMSGFKSWHTPSLDKQDKEQNISFSSSIQASWISPPIEQEPDDGCNTSSVSLNSKAGQLSDVTQNAKHEVNDNDGISSSVSDSQTQISLNNSTSDRPKIRIKSMLALFGNQEEVINDSAIQGSESSSDSCNINQSISLETSDSTPKNIEIKGKRKRSDENNIQANKKEKMDKKKKSNENSDIAEIPAIHVDSDFINNDESLSNNDNYIRNDNDIVELSNESDYNNRNNDIVILSDTENDNEDGDYEETDPLA